MGPLRRFLAAHAVPGLERVESPGGRHVRALAGPTGPAVVAVDLDDATGTAAAHLWPASPQDLAPLTARVESWLGLDAGTVAGTAAADAHLAHDPLLAPLVAARPGLRVPGALDGAETALLAVLGQQVSLRAARTFAGRLVEAFGEPAPAGLRLFPSVHSLREAGPDALRSATGVTGARARTLHALAAAAAAGLALDPAADGGATRAALAALPGIGPWTTEYVAARALRDPDAYPADDLVLKRALGVRTAREAEARAERWRPWRACALLHLWTREVFA